ncbi:hypothetical protein [Ketobacter sp.]|uniref:hypothetical protein n=1 Tax=Ketobacter sp. TaxID=2083498 RepID=UPI0025BF8F6A|nr:hypothetical protein [Ketobacter sp.]
MATVADDSRVINPLQKELACYLSSFSVKPDNAYVRLFNKLRSCLDRINIVTLNYDLLIEQSLTNHGFGIDYNANGGGINLLKPHGSSNFLPQLPKGLTISGNTMIGCGTYVEGLETKAVSTVDEVMTWCKDPRNSDLSPVLAMYAEGKRVVVNRNLITNTQKKYSEIISSSKLVVLVGIKYIQHDKHIWEPIENARPNLFIVDPYPNSTIDWIKDKSITGVTVVKKGFDEAIWDLTKSVHDALYFT